MHKRVRRSHSITVPEVFDALLAEEIGLHVGDGSMNVYAGRGFYQLRGHPQDDRDHYLERITFLYKKLFHLEISLRDMPSTKVFGFQIWSDKLVKFKHEVLGLPLGKKTHVTIPAFIMRDEMLMKAFLRGLFDTDGCIYTENRRGKPYPSVQISMVSAELVNQLKLMLTHLNFRWYCYLRKEALRNRRDCYTLYIRGCEMTRRWFSEIQPRNAKHVIKFLRLGYGGPAVI